ncbi:hypothetical protein [Flavobacterium sp. MMS24-S5]|uniref:hypothetical protein n=1 Tax=Flavobacterium sp. MMS24-S5 TaxID=3416605 RepID=UPI003D03A4B7
MRKFIRYTFLFLFPIVLVLLAIEIFYQIAPNNYTVKNENCAANYQNAEVLILGNSHSFYGLNPVCFDKQTFNLSNISQSMYFDKLLFDKHIDNFKKVKFLVLNIEYTSLSQLKNTDEDRWRKYYYKHYMDLEVPIIQSFDLNNWFVSGTKSFSSNLKLISRYFSEKTIVDCNKYGFGTNYTQHKRAADMEKSAAITIKRHEDNLTDFTENITAIESIIEKCKNKGIQVIIVTMPVTKNYAEKVNKEKLNKIFESALLLQKTNSNVFYLNLFSDSRFSNDDFYDADHLHNLGAKKCSKMVNDFINQKSAKTQF